MLSGLLWVTQFEILTFDIVYHNILSSFDKSFIKCSNLKFWNQSRHQNFNRTWMETFWKWDVLLQEREDSLSRAFLEFYAWVKWFKKDKGEPQNNPREGTPFIYKQWVKLKWDFVETSELELMQMPIVWFSSSLFVLALSIHNKLDLDTSQNFLKKVM